MSKYIYGTTESQCIADQIERLSEELSAFMVFVDEQPIGGLIEEASILAGTLYDYLSDCEAELQALEDGGGG